MTSSNPSNDLGPMPDLCKHNDIAPDCLLCEIERLKAQIERMPFANVWAEIERLRAALQRICSVLETPDWYDDAKIDRLLDKLGDIAEGALGHADETKAAPVPTYYMPCDKHQGQFEPYMGLAAGVSIKCPLCLTDKTPAVNQGVCPHCGFSRGYEIHNCMDSMRAEIDRLRRERDAR